MGDLTITTSYRQPIGKPGGRSLTLAPYMSAFAVAFGGKADMGWCGANVCF